MATFGRLLSNPLIIGVLGTKMLSDLSQSYNASQQESQRQEDEQAKRLEMEGQAGAPMPSGNPRGLFGSLVAKTGLISPETPLSPYERAAYQVGGQEREAAQSQQALAQQRVGIEQQKATATEALAAEKERQNTIWHKETNERLDQQHKDSLQIQQQNQKDREQATAANEELRRLTLESNNQWKDFEKRQQTEKSDDARKANFNQQVNQLLSRQKQVSAMLSSANPADTKTVQSLLDAENGRARTLKEMADKYGYEYDPDQFAPKKIETTSTWGGLGSKSAIVTDTNAAMIGMETAQPDGKYDMNGKRYVVKGGKITGVEDANK